MTAKHDLERFTDELHTIWPEFETRRKRQRVLYPDQDALAGVSGLYQGGRAEC